MTYLLALVVLCGLGAALSVLLLIAARFLANYGPCAVHVNDRDGFIVQGGRSLLDALREGDVFIPSACGAQGTCGYCKIKVLWGGGEVLFTELPHLTDDEIAGGTRLACQVKVRQDIRIWVRPDYLDVRLFHGRIFGARMLTHDTRELHIRLDEPAEIDFTAGQYVQVRVPTPEGPVERAYSISSSPSSRGRIEMVVRLVPGGVGSTYLHRLLVGEPIEFTGPFGDYAFDAATELVCVGGGCGLAPIRSIADDLCRRNPDATCWLFLGVRTPADVFYRQAFERLASQHANVRLFYALSEPRHGEAWDGPVGMIDRVVAAELTDGASRQAFLCGPAAMIEAARAVLREKGVPDERIFFEDFLPSVAPDQIPSALFEEHLHATAAPPKGGRR